MPNQTIDGVPRELLEWAYSLSCAIGYRADPRREALLTMLDAPAPTPTPVAWMRFDDDQKAIFTRSKRESKSEPLYAHPTAYRHTAPAAQPQGEPVAYADPQAFDNFKNLAWRGGSYAKEWMWAKPAPGLIPLYTEQPMPVTAVSDA